MRFSVFAVSPVPDTASARALFDVHDLDDKAVAKVLFHQRKQQTGSSEELRWDQQAIAAITLIQHSVDKVRIESLNLASHSEAGMLEAFYRACLGDGRVVSWDGAACSLPLIHFRSLKHAVSYPDYWQALQQQSDLHLDLCNWLSPTGAPHDRPNLDITARRLGLPGMLGQTGDEVFRYWLAGQHDDVQAYSDLAALNSYLLAVRLFGVTGQLSRDAVAQAHGRLHDALGQRDDDHLVRFRDVWSSA